MNPTRRALLGASAVLLLPGCAQILNAIDQTVQVDLTKIKEISASVDTIVSGAASGLAAQLSAARQKTVAEAQAIIHSAAVTIAAIDVNAADYLAAAKPALQALAAAIPTVLSAFGVVLPPPYGELLTVAMGVLTSVLAGVPAPATQVAKLAALHERAALVRVSLVRAGMVRP